VLRLSERSWIVPASAAERLDFPGRRAPPRAGQGDRRDRL